MEDWVKHVERVKFDALARDIYIYTTTKVACSLCTTSGSYDSIKDASYKVTCAECRGKFWVPTNVANVVPARVHWTNDEMVQATPGGKYYVGDATAKIGSEYHDLATECLTKEGRVVIDGQDMSITKIVPLGAFEAHQYRLILKTV